MTTKERVHRLCVRLAEQSLCQITDDALSVENGFLKCDSEVIAAAFEPTVERLVDSLKWALLYRAVQSNEPNGEAQYQAARAALAELERE